MTKKASITAVGHYLPEKILSNSELEKTLDTTDDWIRSRTGIVERRIVGKDEATSHMSINSAKQILEKRKLNASEIDVIIIATVTPDMLFPSTAALVQNAIGAKNAWAFDLNAACSGFIFSLESAAGLIATGKHEKVLVIGGDTMTSVLDYEDRSTCVLFGDGAGGALLEATNGEDGIIDSILGVLAILPPPRTSSPL